MNDLVSNNMAQRNVTKQAFQFLKFDNTNEDEEKQAKLLAAATKIDEGISRNTALDELIEIDPKSMQGEEPDPANDTRPLYHRLLDQKTRKKELLEESQRMSNFVSRLDDDEINFLEDLDKKRHEENHRKHLEELEAIEEHKRVMEECRIRHLDDEIAAQKSLFSRPNDRLKGSSDMRSKLASLIKIRPKSVAEKADDHSKSEICPSTSESQIARPTTETPLKRNIVDCYADSDSSDEEMSNNTVDPEENDQELTDTGGLRRSTRRKGTENNDSKQSKAPEQPGSGHAGKKESRGQKRKKGNDEDDDRKDDRSDSTNIHTPAVPELPIKGVLKCIGVLASMPNVLPYSSESDTSNSSDEGSDCGPSLLCRVNLRTKLDLIKKMRRHQS